MQYNIWFNVCALIILSELLVLYYKKFHAPFKKYSIFLFMLWCTMVSTISSICNNVLPGIAPVGLIRVSNILYFLSHSLIPPALFLYVYSLTDLNMQDWKQLVLWLIPAVFCTMMVLTSWFSNTIFWLDSSGGYHRGPMLPLLYLTTGYNFFIIAYSLLRNKRMISNRERISIFIFLGMASSAMLFQLIFPKMLVENFICASCLMISQMTVQNPESILDSPSGMLNKQGFSNLLSPLLERRTRFRVGFLVVENYHELEKYFGFERLETKMQVLSSYLKLHTGCTYSRLDNRVYCFVADNADSVEPWEDLFRDLEEQKLQQYLRQVGVGIRFRLKYGTLSCPKDADSFEALMELIEEAAKLSQPELTDMMRLSKADVQNLFRRKQIDELVAHAVENNLLRVVYQPIFSCRENRFCGAEALLRLHTDSLGIISPNEFIPIAEENGCIMQMSKFVVESVCRFIQSPGAAELQLQRIHINLSPVDCMQDNLSAAILDTLREYDVSPSMIGIEITETSINYLPDVILDNLNALSAAGAAILLDDYGTGYSNLKRLENMPLNIVKLDKSLVDNIHTSEAARIILNNTIQMMKALNKQVLAEGVETKEQAEYLWSLGCDYFQGYYFARAMEPAQLETMLHK